MDPVQQSEWGATFTQRNSINLRYDIYICCSSSLNYIGAILSSR